MFAVRRRGFAATASPSVGEFGAIGSVPTLVGTNPSGAAWQLAEGHFVPAKMAPNITFPRPDTETTSKSRYRRAPSGIEWIAPIIVQGGAWPFHYEIVSDGGATGLTVGEDLPADWLTNGLQDYGVMSWDSPVVGSYEIQILVTDQEGTEVPRTFTLTVVDREDTSAFLFVDATNGNNSNSGAYSSPKQTTLGMYGPNKNDSTNANKQIFYRAGTYRTVDFPVFNETVQRVGMTSQKPHVHIGFPGETVIFDNRSADGTQQAYWDYESGAKDLQFSNIRWINPTVIENSVNRKTHIRMGTAAVERACFFRVRFVGNTDDPGSGTNSACVMWGGNPQPGSYFAISQCIYDAIDKMGYALCYDTSDVVCEGNSIVNGARAVAPGGAGGFFFKANTIRRVTVRANVGLGSDIEQPLLYFSQFVESVSDVRENIESCWNRYRNITTKIVAEGAGAVGIGQGNGATGNHYGSFWSYRNNYVNPHIGMFGIGAGGPFEFENDVIQHSGTYTDGFYVSLSAVQPTKTNLATGTSMVDASTLLLTGAARTTYLGTHGCEAV